MSHIGVDRQSAHLDLECHSSKLSQQTVHWVDASFGSKCHVVGLSVDGSSRHYSFTFSDTVHTVEKADQDIKKPIISVLNPDLVLTTFTGKAIIDLMNFIQ